MAQPLPVTGSGPLQTHPSDSLTQYLGFSLRESTGSAGAVVRIWDNASAASGVILDPIALGAGESAREFYDGGLDLLHGIYVEIVSGSVEGSVRVG